MCVQKHTVYNCKAMMLYNILEHVHVSNRGCTCPAVWLLVLKERLKLLFDIAFKARSPSSAKIILIAFLFFFLFYFFLLLLTPYIIKGKSKISNKINSPVRESFFYFHRTCMNDPWTQKTVWGLPVGVGGGLGGGEQRGKNCDNCNRITIKT